MVMTMDSRQTVFRETLRKEKRYEEIIALIKQKMIAGELRYGDKLPTEQEMVDQLGISRTSVREAIKILEAIGIVEIKRGEGMFLRRTSSQSNLNPLIFSLILASDNSRELIEFRQHFENMVIDMASRNGTGEDFGRIRDILQEQLASRELASAEWTELDLKFHYAILQATHNPFIVEIGNTVYELFRSKIEDLARRAGKEQSLVTHELYLKAITQRGRPRASRTEAADRAELPETLGPGRRRLTTRRPVGGRPREDPAGSGADRLPEAAGDPGRQRTRRSRPDGPAVHRDDRNDFGPRAGQEALVGGVEIVPGDAPLECGNPEPLRQFHHEPPGDPFQGPVDGGGGQKPAVADDEQVVRGALRDEPLAVEHDRLDAACVLRFDLGEDVVQVVEALDPRVDPVRSEPAAGRGHHRDTLPVVLLGIEPDRVRR